VLVHTAEVSNINSTINKPLRECYNDSLQRLGDIVVKLVVVAQSLVPRPHKVTIRVVKHLSRGEHKALPGHSRYNTIITTCGLCGLLSTVILLHFFPSNANSTVHVWILSEYYQQFVNASACIHRALCDQNDHCVKYTIICALCLNCMVCIGFERSTRKCPRGRSENFVFSGPVRGLPSLLL